MAFHALCVCVFKCVCVCVCARARGCYCSCIPRQRQPVRERRVCSSEVSANGREVLDHVVGHNSTTTSEIKSGRWMSAGGHRMETDRLMGVFCVCLSLCVCGEAGTSVCLRVCVFPARLGDVLMKKIAGVRVCRCVVKIAASWMPYVMTISFAVIALDLHRNMHVCVVKSLSLSLALSPSPPLPPSLYLAEFRSLLFWLSKISNVRTASCASTCTSPPHTHTHKRGSLYLYIYIGRRARPAPVPSTAERAVPRVLQQQLGTGEVAPPC